MRFFALTTIALLTTTTAVAEPARLQSNANARIIRDYARITFEWPRPVYLSAKTEGKSLLIDFERPVATDINKISASLSPYIKNMKVENGGKRLRIEMASDYKVRSFVSEQISGVDILDVKRKTPAAVAVLKKEEPKKIVENKKTEAEKEPVKQAKIITISAPIKKVDVEKLTSLSPSAGEQVAAVQTPAETTNAQATKVEEVKQQAEVSTAESFKIQADISGDLVNITFPWKERVAAAGFERNGKIYIVFNKAAAIDVADANLITQPAATLEQLNAPGATVVVIKTRPEAGAVFQMLEGTFDWQVSITPAKTKPENAIAVSTVVEEGVPPHVLLGALETAETPVVFSDQDVLDNLIVVPMFSSGKGVLPARSFVDFKLFETMQGVVIQKIADDTQVTQVRNGLRIATERGANISKDLPPIEAGENVQAKMEEGTILFPYEAWKAPAGKDYQKEIASLIRSAAKNKGESGNISKYHRAAEIYLSEGKAAEAIGMLQMVKRIDAGYYADKRLSAMEAAANFLMQRYNDAYQLFNTQELEKSKEAGVWRSLLGEILGTPNQVFDFEGNYDEYISKYPPIIRQRLAILAADRAIGNKEYNAALKIFDQLNKEKVINEVADYVNYLMGIISVNSGQPKDGFDLWQKILDESGREFVKIRAEFSLIAEKYARGEIDDATAAEQLERISLRWRGDSLELNTLKLLSSIYEKKKDWPNAIRVWKALNDSFPNSVEAVAASRGMDDAFQAMFDRDEIGSLTTLDQLFLFHEYRDLLPDNETGDRIAEKLVTKMLALDMLDQATDLLDKRMRQRFEREPRSRAGAQLARVYLMNKEPLKALYALQDSVYGQNPEALNHERTELATRTMIDLNRLEDGLSLIVDEKTIAAEMLRAEIFWRQKDWPKMIETLEAVLKTRGDASKTVNETEAASLVKLAIGYLATDDMAQLQYLRDYFTPLMEGNRDLAVFEFLTRPEITLTTDNFDKFIESLQATKTFLDGYKLSARKL